MASDSLDSVIFEKTVEFVASLGMKDADPYVIEATMKIAVRDLCHELLAHGADGDDLADHLEVMAGVMRDKAREQA